MFYTGAPDSGDPSDWAPTAHVLVAGGIVPLSESQYTATDTVDILREDGIDSVTGKVGGVLGCLGAPPIRCVARDGKQPHARTQDLFLDAPFALRGAHRKLKTQRSA